MALDTIITLTGLKPRELPPSEILQHRAQELASFLPEWRGAEKSGIFAENFFLDNRLQDLVARSRELFEKAGTITKRPTLKPENQLRGTMTF